MNGTCRRACGAILAVSVTLTGCAGSGGPCGSNGAYWKSDGAATVAQGAIGGAAVGGAIGALAGRNLQSAGQGAAAGALLGAGIGCLVSASKNSFATAEDNYNAQLAQMTRLNAGLAQESASLDRQRRQLESDITELRRQRPSAYARQVRARQQLQSAQAQLADAQKIAAAAREDLDKSNSLVADAERTYGSTSQQAAQIRAERDKTQRAVIILNGQVNSLLAATQSIGV